MAAAVITGPAALGLLQRWQWLLKLLGRLGLFDPDALVHLEAISERLVERNSLRLRQAASSTTGIDEAMVVYDQWMVESYLRKHRLSASARCSIDRLLAMCGHPALASALGIDRDLVTAVRAQRESGSRLTFFSLGTRVAIGWHLVRSFEAP